MTNETKTKTMTVQDAAKKAGIPYCACGAPAIATSPTWAIGRTADGEPCSVGPRTMEPVCYGMGLRRYEARDYLEHVLRLAEARGDREASAIIRARIERAPIPTSVEGEM
jgi:hypothetical protein